MIEIKYFKNSYRADVSNIDNIFGMKINIPFKFDTGAVNTIVPINVYCESDVSYEKQDKILDAIKSKNENEIILFTSASGNIMPAIHCMTKNVNISGLKLDEFYYYVTFRTTSRTSLLGDDFISNCLFTHSIKGNININSFHIDHYKEQFKNDNNTGLLNILSSKYTNLKTWTD